MNMIQDEQIWARWFVTVTDWIVQLWKVFTTAAVWRCRRKLKYSGHLSDSAGTRFINELCCRRLVLHIRLQRFERWTENQRERDEPSSERWPIKHKVWESEDPDCDRKQENKLVHIIYQIKWAHFKNLEQSSSSADVLQTHELIRRIILLLLRVV